MNALSSTPKSRLWLIGGAAIVVLLFVIGGVFYWRLPSSGGAVDIGWDGRPAGAGADGWTADGVLGQTSSARGDKTYAIAAPFIRKGDRMAVSGYAEHPGRTRGAVWLLLVRLNDKWRNEAIGGWGGNSGNDIAYGHASYTAKDGKLFTIKYALNADPPETFSLGDKAYNLAAGRLFVIDLRTAPVNVMQLNEDVTALLPKEDAASGQLEKSVKELQERNEAVRKFWQAE